MLASIIYLVIVQNVEQIDTMKKVVDSNRCKEIEISNIDDTKFYGVSTKVFGVFKKGFISRASYSGGEFIVFLLDELTKGNALDRNRFLSSHMDLKDFIFSLIKLADVYQFDTGEELALWLAQPIN